MATTKMTLTRALSKLKVLEKRITDARSNQFFAHKVGPKLAGTPLDEAAFARAAQSDWDELSSLIDSRLQIKRAIVKANADTNVVINGETMTIATAVDRKLFYPQVLTTLQNVITQYHALSKNVEKHNQGVTERLDKLLESLVGKDKKTSDGEMVATSKPFLDANQATIVDPYGVYAKAQKEIEKIVAFLNEVDYTLSEANAKTEIEVDLSISV